MLRLALVNTPSKRLQADFGLSQTQKSHGPAQQIHFAYTATVHFGSVNALGRWRRFQYLLLLGPFRKLAGVG